MQHARHDA